APTVSLEDFSIDWVKQPPEPRLKRALIAEVAMLTKAIATEEKLADAHPAEDLLSLEGMDKDLAMELAVRGVITREDLAEQSIDDLLDIDGIDDDRAGKLIMAARAHWFE
ncbi:helix-hairpin-helix domain-containing protein, partial [Pseudomonas fluorescens]|uniref:helix-hairpin-helix domain-containing protein n=1 Tax=Pseudomonas fluorescens TaxID=294 RepID=UPI003CFD6203